MDTKRSLDKEIAHGQQYREAQREREGGRMSQLPKLRGLDELRGLLEGRTVGCPNVHQHAIGGIQSCWECFGKGSFPDPRFTELLNVVRMKCPCLAIDPGIPHLPYEDFPATCKRCYVVGRHSPRCNCGGTDYIPRYWDDLPPGALAGALVVALADGLNLRMLVEADGPGWRVRVYQNTELLTELLTELWNDGSFLDTWPDANPDAKKPDLNQVAIDAVTQVVEEMKE